MMEKTYALSLEMCSAQAVVMLVEVHHLEPVELSRDLLDLLRFARLLDLNSFGVPIRSQ